MPYQRTAAEFRATRDLWSAQTTAYATSFGETMFLSSWWFAAMSSNRSFHEPLPSQNVLSCFLGIRELNLSEIVFGSNVIDLYIMVIT